MLLSFSKCFSKGFGWSLEEMERLRQAEMMQQIKQHHDKGGPHAGDEETKLLC